MVNGRAAARSGEWAQHFSNASCFRFWQIGHSAETEQDTVTDGIIVDWTIEWH